MTRVRMLIFVAISVAIATPARADVTGFIGANLTPVNRQVQGLAVGFGVLLVGIELEYADTADDAVAQAPSLKTGMGNVLLQAPLPIFGFQPYFTGGAGFYREAVGTQRDSGFGLNTGGGVKVSLIGPVRLRIDYRMFTLKSGALYSPTHRIYAGINLAF